MFTGKVPFEADSYMGVLTKHMYMVPAPPSELRSELKSLGALEEVILRCLQKSPQARYENLAALLLDLEQRVSEGARPAAHASVLADQLELPLRADVARPPAARYQPVLIVTLAFAAGLALVLALRRGSQSRAEMVAPRPSAVASPSLARPAPPPRRAANAPEAPEAPSAAGSVGRPLASAVGPQIPARKPTLSGPRPVASPTPKPAGSSAKRPLGGTATGEIVDPWAPH
jgi:serine/threonine-protein kinase